ncbi:LysR family transcriptional regulator [Roseobacter sp. YSTF-M11]|uniref:LysR family transcriptional regulator n=1 Tax=Roseobacter insulae TaxID=2859783 RepID=A0A9X1K1F8_9RHOB|nr:LysR family transcriptional regulator [Roseobacter insulae]MBW4707443.1 LysR family transcriptional regulator [Roseobacter insulae]
MKHEQLVTLEAIVTSGTFRGAAERLHKSQSAISHAIKLLEEELGVILLSREAYRPKLTLEGEVFYREASRVLQQMRALKSTASRLRAREEAELRIAVTNTLPLETVLTVLAEVGRAFPATHIRLTTESMGGPVARLMEEQTDLAIATLDGVSLAEVEARPVAEVTIRPVAHPMLVAGFADSVLPIAAMQGLTQIVVAGTGGPAHDQSRDVLPGGLRWTVSDFTAKKQVILAGLGWGGLPDHLTVAERQAGTLVPINVESYPPRHSVLHVIRRRDVPVGLVANDLWEKLSTLSR